MFNTHTNSQTFFKTRYRENQVKELLKLNYNIKVSWLPIFALLKNKDRQYGKSTLADRTAKLKKKVTSKIIRENKAIFLGKNIKKHHFISIRLWNWAGEKAMTLRNRSSACFAWPGLGQWTGSTHCGPWKMEIPWPKFSPDPNLANCIHAMR